MYMSKGLVVSILAIALLSACSAPEVSLNTSTQNVSEQNTAESVVVSTRYGLLQGQIVNGVTRFLGVPYADAKERFVRASEPKKWSGIKLANQYGPRSPQSAISGLELTDKQENTSDNCTNLNIWSPGVGNRTKRPVMVWLHGGGFSLGSANESMYDGADLSAQNDVVVVSVNHRLNAFGFLDLSAYGEKYKDSANLGLWDIVDALSWIKNNIEAFGGDPSNITLFGQSGGGAKGLALMSSPYAKGLFSKVIVQSGATETMGVHFVTKKAGARLAEHVLENLKIDPKDIAKLSEVPRDELIQASFAALKQTGDDFKIHAALGNSYCMDFEPEVDGKFLPSDPVTDDGFAAAGKDVTLMIGSNLNEWSGYFKNKPVKETAELKKALIQAYPDKKTLKAEMVDSALIRLPLLKIMTHKARQNGANVFAYVFTYGNSNHGAELPYVFNHHFSNRQQKKLSSMLGSVWANFAKTGIPSAKDMPEWNAFTEDSGATMLLDLTPKLRYRHDEELHKLLNPAYRMFNDERISSADRLHFRLGKKVEADRFSGTVYTEDLIKKGDRSGFAVTNSIVFEPGVHSSWHRHGGMIVMATDGIGYYQEEGKPVQILRKGDIVKVKEGVRHWHGAAPDSWFSQIVIYDSEYQHATEPLEFADYKHLELAPDGIRDQKVLGMTFETGDKPFLSSNFSGNVFVSSLIEKDNPAKTAPVHYVAFDKGVVNKWHSHEGGQLLIVTDGIGYHQIEGEEARLLTPGDVVFCPPGVKHWHGASKGDVFGHLAANADPEHTKVVWYDFPKNAGE